jgi:hypothetical protein
MTGAYGDRRVRGDRPVLRAIRLALFSAPALASLAACSDPVHLEYQRRRPFLPPMQVYEPWWNELRACSRQTGELDGIRWFLAERIGRPMVGESTLGEWLSNREITLRAGHEHRVEVVKHEMLHDLLRGDRDHEDEAWEACVGT